MNDTLQEIENAIDDVVVETGRATKTAERLIDYLGALLEELREALADAEKAQRMIEMANE